MENKLLDYALSEAGQPADPVCHRLAGLFNPVLLLALLLSQHCFVLTLGWLPFQGCFESCSTDN